MTNQTDNQVQEQVKTAFDYGELAANAKDCQTAAISLTAEMLAKTGDKKSDAAKAIQTDYKAGYVREYLTNRKTETSKERAYLILRMSGAQVSDDKINDFGRRSELEHKAERASDASWTVVKRHAFPTVSKNAGTSEKTGTEKTGTEKTETPKFVPAKNSAELFQRVETLMAMIRTECDSAASVKDDPAMKLRVMVSNWNSDLKEFAKKKK